jgi:hypothetical protein
LKTLTLLASLVFVSVCAAPLQVSSPGPHSDSPEYATGDELVRPEGYREWVFVTSGVRMSNSESCGEGATFVNVFVTPPAYIQFLATGSWPDKTILVEEKRGSTNKTSLNKATHYQADFMGISVKVKDVGRFVEKWAYYSFDSSAKTAKPNPKIACWQCHYDRGAVDSSFVQFYPTLKPVAQKFGTYHEALAGPESY